MQISRVIRMRQLDAGKVHADLPFTPRCDLAPIAGTLTPASCAEAIDAASDYTLLASDRLMV